MLALQHVGKTYPNGVVGLEGLDLAVDRGELLVVVGPSGSGKSTLLRLIAGLETPDRGTIRIDGRPAEGLAPRDRDVAMVFQNQAPYPYLSVFENLAFGLRARRRPKEEVRTLVEETARSLGLIDVLKRMPGTLSGGQRQRVALGRALARRPKILLLDEPFSNLDPPLRVAIRSDLLALHRRWGITTIHVTHDQGEALTLGDRVAVLEQGRLAQVGRPDEVYDRPATRFVAGFLGDVPMNFLPCEVSAGPTLTVIGAEAGPVGIEGAESGRWELGIRPEDVVLASDSGSVPVDPSILRLQGTVTQVERMGSAMILRVRSGGVELAVRAPREATVRAGERVALGLPMVKARLFDPETGRAKDGRD